jgi:hypothetical protein
MLIGREQLSRELGCCDPGSLHQGPGGKSRKGCLLDLTNLDDGIKRMFVDHSIAPDTKT